MPAIEKEDAYNRYRCGAKDSQYGDAALSGYCDVKTLQLARMECAEAAADPDTSPSRSAELREALRLMEEAYRYHEGY